MKLSTVLTACNDKYNRFIPIFIKAWKYFYPDVKIIIIYIGSIPQHQKQYSEFIHEFHPPSNLPTAYVAQTIRLLWPALLGEKEGVLITDMDMIPANSVYFTKSIKHLDDNLFVNYRQGDDIQNQIYMCYNIAPSKIWAEIFHIQSDSDVHNFLVKNFNHEYDSIHGGRGWCIDQELFYQYFMKWKLSHPNAYIFLTDALTKFARFDFNEFQYIKKTFIIHVSRGKYADCHLFSAKCPYSEEELTELIDNLQEIITKKRDPNLI